MKTRNYTYTVGPDITKQLIRQLVEVIAIGALLAAISTIIAISFSEQLHSILLAVYGSHPDIFTPGTGRAFLFLIIGDLTIVPIYLVRILRLLKSFRMKKGASFKQKVWLTFAFVVMVPACLIVPYQFITGGGRYAWRDQFAYDLITTYLGLSLLGSAALWVSSAFIAAALHFLPLIWFKATTEE